MKQFHYKAIIYIFIFLAGGLYAQELPPIEKFTPEDYGGDNQNWMISQAPNKFIYVANNEGLLEFNGSKWKMYRSPNKTIIRAVKVVNDRIYTGCYMEFGYWEKDTFGKLQYSSLIPKLREKMVEDEHIWNIITYEEWILFQSFNRIYFYNTKSNDFTIIKSDNTISKVFNIDNIIYYHVTNEGIYKIEGGESKLFANVLKFKEDRIVNIFPIEEGLLIQTRRTGFYVYKNNTISVWNIPAAKTLGKMNVFNSIQLNDKSFVLGTISNGIIYLSEDGRIEYQINQNNGLSNNTALSLFEDKDENIWVGLDNGINCINIKSPVRIFDDDKGALGTVYASIIFNNFLYLGTNQGLFYKKIGSDDESFKFINGTAGQVWSLFAHGNELFCGHHNGTYILDKGEATLVVDNPGTWNFRSIPGMKNTLLQGNYNGLNVIFKDSNNWKLKNKVEEFDNSARYFEIMNNNEVWVSHGYKGVFKFTIDENFTTIKNVLKDSTVEIGKNSSLVKYKNRILYACEEGIFGYDTIKKGFIKDTILSPIVKDDAYLSGKQVVDETQKLWTFSKDNISYVSVNNLTNQFKINKIAIPAHLRKVVKGYENISHLQNNDYLIGTDNGYITLDLSRITASNEYTIILNSVALNSLETANEDIDIHNSGEFKYIQNSIIFNYSVPEYDKYQVVEYQYKLNGQYDEWSDWTNKSELTFDNLPFGDYNFEVRAKVGNKLTNNVASYNFKIMRPWYLSSLALILYILSIVGIILVIVKISKKYYKRQHEHKHLESEQLITSIKNEKLNQAIENKNRELAISTMSIIKKNEVLSSIKKELKNNGHELENASVIRLIDSNINNEKDWEFFEQAFNNVDKEFLDKVKKAHSNLTPNDLRLCAYLRLNLSSKEIAPLLNITTKSVETRRYRLRKKMNLNHDDSLVNHILEI